VLWKKQVNSSGTYNLAKVASTKHINLAQTRRTFYPSITFAGQNLNGDHANKQSVINEYDTKGINHIEDTDLTWKTPLKRRGKNHGAGQ
jgi:hypothetical protein